MAQINRPTDYFNTVLYTGNGSTQSITGVSFSPEFCWLKSRSVTGYHGLFDIVRGTNNWLFSNATDAELTTSNGLSSFDADGFTIGDNPNINTNSATNVSWNWLAGGTASSNTDGSITSQVSANTTSGFSIVSWTADGTNNTVGHGLGQTPSIVIAKNRSATSNWDTITNVIDGSIDYLKLNLTDAKSDLTGYTLNSSVFSINYPNTNNIIAYCFAEKKGFSKFGSYTGTGSGSAGAFIYTGFKPAMVIIKNTSAAQDWVIKDNKRDIDNQVDKVLFPNSSNAEGSGSGMDFYSNGFVMRTSADNVNKSGSTMIYMAFAEQPLVGTNNVPATAR
jgi:hypothetical protein